MLVITIYGIPEATSNQAKKSLGLFLDKLREAVWKTPGSGMQKEDVICWFPVDRLDEGLGEEFIINVNGILKTFPYGGSEGLAREIAQDLANALKEMIRLQFPKAKIIECFVEPFNYPNVRERSSKKTDDILKELKRS
jgi:hypothetical protein